VQAQATYDTQIACAFLGMGDQLGYANLIERLLAVKLDKGAQFTEWSRRPLSSEQLSYALDDVRYLPAAWERIRERLEHRERLTWVREECERMAESWAGRAPPDEMYRRVRGWNGLRPRAQGALRALAAWRERESLRSNRPPSYLMNDRSMLEVARRRPKDEAGLREVRGLGAGTVQRHGRAILRWIEEGSNDPPEAPPRAPDLPPQGQGWPALLGGVVAARCREASIAPRFVAPRREIEELTEWWLSGDRDVEPDLPLLRGWRRELAGQEVLDWLSGKTAIAADPDAEAGIRVVDLGEG
jgi:ribonuclease D